MKLETWNYKPMKSETRKIGLRNEDDVSKAVQQWASSHWLWKPLTMKLETINQGKAKWGKMGLNKEDDVNRVSLPQYLNAPTPSPWHWKWKYEPREYILKWKGNDLRYDISESHSNAKKEKICLRNENDVIQASALHQFGIVTLTKKVKVEGLIKVKVKTKR